MLRVEEPHRHHFRLVVRHPDRAIDFGLTHALRRSLNDLAYESEEKLSRRYHDARNDGPTPVPLRHVHESPELWQDDFWNHLG